MKNKELEKALFEGKKGFKVRHFKNKYYKVLNVAQHTETNEKLVIYQALYEPYGIFARPFEMFISEVDKEKYPNAMQKFRMEIINNE